MLLGLITNVGVLAFFASISAGFACVIGLLYNYKAKTVPVKQEFTRK